MFDHPIIPAVAREDIEKACVSSASDIFPVAASYRASRDIDRLHECGKRLRAPRPRQGPRLRQGGDRVPR